MKKALLIGINYVRTPESKLYGCINDAMSMRNMLVDAYGYDLDNVKVLRDDTNETNILPSRDNILNSINELMNQSKNLSEIWIHYSGHGSSIQDYNNDEDDNRDEVVIPCDYNTKGLISDDQLRSLLDKAQCRVMITMDCCNSGTNWDIVYSYPIKDNIILRRQENGKKMNNKNIFMIAGARDNQYAGDYFDFEMKIPMGVFTMSLLKCLRKRNHNISLLQLYLDIYKDIKSSGHSQECLLSSSNEFPYIKFERTNSNIKNSNSNNNNDDDNITNRSNKNTNNRGKSHKDVELENKHSYNFNRRMISLMKR